MILTKSRAMSASLFSLFAQARTGLVALAGVTVLLCGQVQAADAPSKKVTASKAPVKKDAKAVDAKAEEAAADDKAEGSKPEAKPETKSGKPAKAFSTGSSDALVDFIGEKIRQGWADNEIEPSDVADDHEWIRRVYLDIVGHIPPADAVEAFVADKDKAKRTKLIDTLLDDPAYVRNWTTIWTNLSIGRQTPRRVSRTGMMKFYREAFAKNRPWKDVVFDIVSAEGHYEENGAVNFLLAQMTMNDEEVQATAKTTRLFLCMQVQCTQCHNHPFNEWKQDQFWQFNSFFRQARRVDHRKYDPKTGRQEDDYSELVAKDFSGPVYFERRDGLMKVAYPTYFDKRVGEGEEVNRREELAKLLVDGESPIIARAAVNRMWAHFLGYGFTKPVDDMGPHNPPSNPELLDRLTSEFVKSGHDLKQLIRWIANSEPYNLTSQTGKHNTIDNPTAGETPQFSKVYVKPMEAEQLYDSLIIATDAHKSGRSSWEQADQQRQQWMRQFVIAFGNDENEESSTFNGTIPQALMMMNGELVQNALSAKKGSYLETVLSEKGTDIQKINRLYLSTLTRQPSKRELAAAQKLFKANPDKFAAYQDLFWALLNSNEFIMNH